MCSVVCDAKDTYVLVCCVQIALDKIFRFASSHVFENEVAGLLCADLCTAAGKVLCVYPSVCAFMCHQCVVLMYCIVFVLYR